MLPSITHNTPMSMNIRQRRWWFLSIAFFSALLVLLCFGGAATATDTTVTKDQTASGGTWNTLGTYHLQAGTSVTVTLKDSGTGGNSTIADAIRFEHTGGGPDETFEQTSAVLTGTWTTTGGFSAHSANMVKSETNGDTAIWT